MRNTSLDLTHGDVLGGLLAFSVPSLIGNLLHQVYSLTDSIVVGRILGVEALAAVGCTMPLILLLAALMIGTNIGVGVLLSQAFGARDMQRMRRGFFNSLYVGLGISLVLALFGAPLAKPILILMGTPEGPLQNAVAYLRINFLTCICPMLYYLFSCAFRGMGDSRTDLYCLIVSVGMVLPSTLIVASALGCSLERMLDRSALSRTRTRITLTPLLVLPEQPPIKNSSRRII